VALIRVDLELPTTLGVLSVRFKAFFLSVPKATLPGVALVF
jgi:hypothetical protein